MNFDFNDCPICEQPLKISAISDSEYQYIACSRIEFGGSAHYMFKIYRYENIIHLQFEISQKYSIIFSNNNMNIKVYNFNNEIVNSCNINYILWPEKYLDVLYLEKIINLI